MVYTESEVERIAKVAFEVAMKRGKKLCSVDKANVLEVSQFWRNIVHEIHKEFADVELNDMYVDNAAMQIVRNPKQFDVIVTDNMFGDIITDLGAMIQGGMGIAAGGNINPEGVSMFEPMGGSAPKYAGKNVINPMAAIASGAMMLDFLGEEKAAKGIEAAIVKTIANMKSQAAGKMGMSTTQVGDMVADFVAKC